MRSCLILGSGRSGTSLLAGTLAEAGYHMGRDLIPPTAGNPRGYFEDREVNRINEELLAPLVRPRPRLIGRWLFRDRPLRNQRWLARLPTGSCPSATASLNRRITAVVAEQPFCLKDPRFSYTLPVWSPYTADALRLCVFRDPASTAVSIQRELKAEPYLQSLVLSRSQILRIWEASYRNVLEFLAPQGGEWIFVHYEQILRGDALPLLGERLEVELTGQFADPKLKRSAPDGEIPASISAIYSELCKRATFHEAHAGP